MKPILQNNSNLIDSSIAVHEFNNPNFYVPWHFHPQYELVLVIKSEGKRFVGDSINNFSPGDLVLIGSNLPHWYRNDAVYYENNSKLSASSIVIWFKENFLGDGFLSVPEAISIKQILRKSMKGLEICGGTRNKITKMIVQLPDLKGMDRLLHFLAILNLLAKSNECSILSLQGAVAINEKDSEPINKIFDYVMKNLKKQISINEISSLVNMCPATFCRYFKKRTRKTFTCFLNEIRIGHACKMLIEQDFSIREICFSSGFNNISYFNRQFKAIKKTTPNYYKQEYYTRKMGKLHN